jgi:hypothetical protein
MLLSLSCIAVDRAASLSASERAQQLARLRALAIEAVRRALQLGFRDRSTLEHAAFAPLAPEPAFQELLRQLGG